MTHLKIQSVLNDKIKAAQSSDLQIQKILEEVKKGQRVDFTIKGDDSLWYGKRLCVPNNPKRKRKIMEEPHETSYLVHLGSIKMYKDLKECYWWNNMKCEIADFVSKYLNCQLSI